MERERECVFGAKRYRAERETERESEYKKPGLHISLKLMDLSEQHVSMYSTSDFIIQIAMPHTFRCKRNRTFICIGRVWRQTHTEDVNADYERDSR